MIYRTDFCFVEITGTGRLDCCDPANDMLCTMLDMSCSTGGIEATTEGTSEGLDCCYPPNEMLCALFGMSCTGGTTEGTTGVTTGGTTSGLDCCDPYDSLVCELLGLTCTTTPAA